MDKTIEFGLNRKLYSSSALISSLIETFENLSFNSKLITSKLNLNMLINTPFTKSYLKRHPVSNHVYFCFHQTFKWSKATKLSVPKLQYILFLLQIDTYNILYILTSCYLIIGRLLFSSSKIAYVDPISKKLEKKRVTSKL